MSKRIVATAVLAAMAAAGSARAEATDPNTGGLTFGASVDWTTSYFFRGYNQEDTGLIVQPGVTVGFNAFTSDDVSVDLTLGTWNSFHSEQTGGDNVWYESDLYAVAGVSAYGFNFNLIYTVYFYPNNAFETIQELGFQFGYDDAKHWENVGLKDFALNPVFSVFAETDDGNGSEDIYAEIALAPSFGLDVASLSLSFPIKFGFSVDDYYVDNDGDNEIFGYASIGAMASIPLPMPEKYGSWSLTGGVEYIQLFADSAENANDGGQDYELLAKVGISMSY